MNKYLRSALILIGLAVVDAALIMWLLLDEDEMSDGLTTAFITIPSIVLINLLLALVSWMCKQKLLCSMLLLNAFIAPLLFNKLSEYNFEMYIERNFTVYNFTYNQNKFALELRKNGQDYSIEDVTKADSGSTTSIMSGRYEVSGDTIILITKSRKVFIAGNKLVGFPKGGVIIPLLKNKGH